MKKIAPSLLSADFSNLNKEIKMLEEAGAHVLHIDVMDGHFVPNITIGPLVVEAIHRVSNIPLDVHLMIDQPDDFVNAFMDAGASYLTVHVESTVHLHRVIQKIKSRGIKAGVALNPHTPLISIKEVLQDIDLILIMSVNPGFGGQVFIDHTLNKLRELQGMLKLSNLTNIEVEVDGGIKLNNIEEISDAGGSVFVSGSGIFNTKDPKTTIQNMISLINP
jgi:ribulose-phosphate 3-epimerase